MQMNGQPPRRRRLSHTVQEHIQGKFYRRIILSLVAVIVVMLVGFGFLIAWNMQGSTSVSSRTVKFGFENIGELATQSGYFTNVQVVEGDRDILGFVVPFTHKKYIYSYDGIIKAGVDFSDIHVDVNELSHKIVVDMPAPKILSIEIDEESLQIYDETNNVFNRLKLKDINESLAELKKETQETALKQGILTNAEQNARQLVKGFISGIYDLTAYQLEFHSGIKEEVQAP